MSPLSASMALGMTMNGASGSTFDEMRSTLGLGLQSSAEINASYRSLIDMLRALDRTVDVRIANAIWYRAGFPFETSFLDESKQFFDAKVAPLDFSAPGAVPTINDWVKASTNGKIDNIVDDPIAADVVMYLINAIYFNGSWTTRFDRSLTKPDQFTTVDGSAAPIANDASHRHGSGWRDGGCAGGGAPVRWGCVCDDHPQPCSMTRRSR